jgi:Asp-tRNA(Asn)/Glu-tRNA(Gln) amidotransferase A subunit family amidase
MPVLLKDNYDTYDHPSTSGSYSMLGHQAGVDANSVAGLRAAGALILGKANQDEFAFFTTGFSGRAIQVMNAYNTSQSPAGSSSGTGASLAANFALGGTGSDTCQSIRHPSSVEALVGIRPSLGVISQHGIFPLSHARDTGGPMTRTVRDAALMLTAMSGVDARDPKTLDFPASARPASYTQYLDRKVYGVAGRTIGILRQLGSNTEPYGTDAQGELIEAAAAKMADMGAQVVDVYLPDFVSLGAGSTHYDMNDYFRVFESEGGHSYRHCVSSTFTSDTNGRGSCLARDGIMETLLVDARTAGLIGVVAATESPDKAPTDEELRAIVAMRDYVTSVMDAITDAEGHVVLDAQGHTIRVDALLLSPGPTGGRTCDFGSTTQMGSIVVPVGFDTSVGVPRGMEIFVRRFDEGTGIGIAYDFEQATHHRKPPELTPSPLAANATLADFNARQQQALMTATSVAPEDLAIDVYLQALEELVGP